jgi:hypothetical protein
MSIRVELSQLRDIAARQAPFAYLLTVSDDESAHAVAITPRIGAGSITCSVGNRSTQNALTRPKVSLVWPPAEPGDYSLIVDGRASLDGEVMEITPERAVRHRPAPGGGSDCAPVPLAPN